MRKSKKIFLFLLVAFMMFPAMASAESEISVYVDANKLTFDVPPQTVNDRTMVPLRVIFESLGATVEWFEDTRTVKATLDGKVISLTLDNNVMYVNESSVTLDAPAFETGGRTLVPVRAISEAFGATVGWQEETRTVTITTQPSIPLSEAFKTVKTMLLSKGKQVSAGIYATSRNIAENEGMAFLSYDNQDQSIFISYDSKDNTSSVSLLVYDESKKLNPMIVVSANDTAAFCAEYSDGHIVVLSNKVGKKNADTVNKAVSNFAKALTIIMKDLGCNVTVSNLGMIMTENTASGAFTIENLNEIKIMRAENKILMQSLHKDKLANTEQSSQPASSELVAAVKGIPYFIPLESNKGPIIILKADDLTVGSYQTFDEMYNILIEEGITNVSFGIIGKKCEGDGSDELWQYVKSFVEKGAELWHHGWEHKIDGDAGSEFSGGYNYDEMKQRVADTLNLVKDHTGYEIKTLGAPGNKVNAEFASMLNTEFPQIDKIFFSKGLHFNAFHLDKAIYPEKGSNGVTYDHFISVYKPEMEYAVVQFHPNRLKAYDLWDEFRKMIQYLKSQNCTFMTPTQYVEYASNKF